MWSRRAGRRGPCGPEELRGQRREREAALRKARRQQQLVSKRLLREDGPAEAGAAPLENQEMQQLLRTAQRGAGEKEKEAALGSLRRGLQHPQAQRMFIRSEGSVRALIGLLTSSRAALQLEAARCLHELSHADDRAVAEACLPSTSYLLTYLSGHSADFIELCLYTLGNLAVESEAVRKQLLPQGVISAMAACIQSPHPAVLEALGYALSQLLQAEEAADEIIPRVLASPLLQPMLRLLRPTPERGAGVAVEFAWCLHYIVCSQVDNPLLISQGALSTLAELLLGLAGAVSEAADTGLELLACPVLRSLGNLLAEESALAAPGWEQLRDERILVAVFVLVKAFLRCQSGLVPECLWLLNNLTGAHRPMQRRREGSSLLPEAVARPHAPLPAGHPGPLGSRSGRSEPGTAAAALPPLARGGAELHTAVGPTGPGAARGPHGATGPGASAQGDGSAWEPAPSSLLRPHAPASPPRSLGTGPLSPWREKDRNSPS
ncbi:transmembrane and coiled-coil domain-containing protein 6 isoform X2 [Tachyglossus aculeatus]|uniref:transmembrane and coiled-coil domain-containing protein 6 isoform X2 n=1 Tax=Tachyglossus aculeatus TaxID=9261 RepID=UPI0018F73C6A|nr:transmembrane and coiled-coil domain-containing protein 6 isoform X2 [Tachyglossus aculeatus]